VPDGQHWVSDPPVPLRQIAQQRPEQLGSPDWYLVAAFSLKSSRGRSRRVELGLVQPVRLYYVARSHEEVRIIRIATATAITAAVLSLAACQGNTGATASSGPQRQANVEPRCVAAEPARSSHHELLRHWPDAVVLIILTTERC
jgi:hypothetical protein